MPPRPRRGKKVAQLGQGTKPEVEVASENEVTPPAGGNSRVLHDFAVAAGITRERMKRLENALICAEVVKRPDLMVCGAAFTPDGPLLGPGLKAPTVDDLDSNVIRDALKSLAKDELNDEQRAKVKQASLWDDAPTTLTEAKRSYSEVDDEDDFDDDGPVTFDWNCDQVRRRINTFIESGDMKVTEFQRAIGVNSNSYGRFMKMKGAWRGIDNSTMSGAYKFFKKREREGVKMPKKRKAVAAETVDLSDITLDGEDSDSVEVFDSCDEVRRKISAHLRKPGVTQAQFLKDLAAQFHTRGQLKIQSKQLNDFRAKKGADAGNTSAVFYGAYVFFEKLRIKEGKPKSKHRMEMERIWGDEGGFDIKHGSHNKGVWVMKGEVPVMDQFGKFVIHGR